MTRVPALLLAVAVAGHSSMASAQVLFSDQTRPAGVDSPVDVQGVAWADVDGDGDLDAYLTLVLSAVIGTGKRLYVNNGDGTFTEEAAARGVNDDQTGFGACFADHDEDGDDDLALANGLLDASFLADALRLYENDGGGSFRDIAGVPPLDAPGSGRSLAWADHDNDGDVDLFVTTPALQLVLTEPQFLFDNLGGGVFADVTASAGVAKVNPDDSGTGAAWADFDLDGDQDLFLTYAGLPYLPDRNRLFRNDGGTFVDATPPALEASEYSNGAAWGDCDNDGDFDLYVANSGVQTPPIIGTLSAPNQLFRNDGGGAFTDIAAAAGVVDAGHVSFSAAWGDFDNDGWLDLYVTNSPLNSSDPANKLFRNLGNCTFEDIALAAGVKDSGSGQGTALGDYDGDGDLDIFVANLFSDTNVTAHLYRNDSPRRSWLIVDTQGTVSNRDGVGARLVLRAGSLVQTRHVYAGSGYLSQDSFDVEFGLGDLPAADDLTITWPSGCVQVVPNPPLNQRLVVVEDCLPGFDALAVGDEPCASGLTLTWDRATFPSGTGHYEVRRSAVSCDDAGRQAELLPRPAGLSFTDDATIPGLPYSYQVLAVDDLNGTFSWQCAGPVVDVAGGGFVVSATADPNPACAPADVTFTATEPATGLFEWDFDGDGATDDVGPVVTRSYPSDGSFDVTLTVTDAAGCPASTVVPVVITPDLATIVDPASLRVRRLGDVAAPIELSWQEVSGAGAFIVHESVDDASVYGGPPGPGAAPAIASPRGTLVFVRDVALVPGQCAYYQVHGGSCP